MLTRAIKANTVFVTFSVIFFLLGVPSGYILYERAYDTVMPKLQELKELMDGKTKAETAKAIFLNNYQVSLILIPAGILIIPTLLIMYGNGFILGFLIKLIETEGYGIDYFLKGIIPHGIFELPAIFLSAAIGMRIGTSVLKALVAVIFSILKTGRIEKKGFNRVKQSIKEAAVIHFTLVLPLLVAAALIESYVTPLILGQ